MKRLIFCFDGTTNKLTSDTPTNVVLVAASIPPVTEDGVTQIVHYDEGVGTTYLPKITSMAGIGLLNNVREAYAFLVFNYEPGDEIFVFGFSRGGFSAQTFVGMVRHLGVIDRLHAGRIDDGIAKYQKRLAGLDGAGQEMRRFRATYATRVCIGAADDQWREQHVRGYVCGSSPPLTIAYLGIWDAVKAIGFPEMFRVSRHLNKKWAFHDSSLTSFVRSARHAVALDEQRALFPPVLWDNVAELNEAVGASPDARKAPYQQRWFPGEHGSVGGGGDIRGLSDGALSWVIAGAKRAGLVLDIGVQTRIYDIQPDYRAPLQNQTQPEGDATYILRTDRAGPDQLWEVSSSAVRRWQEDPQKLPGRVQYRPKSLGKVGDALRALPPVPPRVPAGSLLARYEVKRNDNLGTVSQHFYGDPSHRNFLYLSNRHVLDDPDELDPGDILDIPVLPDEGA